MTKNNFPPGWDEGRVRDLIAYYDSRSEDEQIAEDEAGMAEQDEQAVISVPVKLLPEIRKLIANSKSA
jgi:hypothetical protein